VGFYFRPSVVIKTAELRVGSSPRHEAAFGAMWRTHLSDGRKGQTRIRCGFALGCGGVADVADSAASKAVRLYFSIVQRKALTPNDFDSLEALTDRLLRFGQHYRQLAQPFDWTFTRTDLEQLLARIDNHEPQLRLAA
jgi:hypothetical protein